jgi:trk system potassium uptake protein TrkA
MRVAIAGAGAVGQSIARKLLADGHKVLLIERRRASYRPDLVPAADWMLADSCELAALQAAGIHMCDVVVATAGDDKVNLVFSMLSKTEFAVPRVVARINNPSNHWLFTEAWGVDVAVDTPSRLVAAVEEVVSVGDLVRLMTMQQGRGTIVEITLPEDTHLTGTRISDLALPHNAALVTIVRDQAVLPPTAAFELAAGDEIMIVAGPDEEDLIRAAFGVEPAAARRLT